MYRYLVFTVLVASSVMGAEKLPVPPDEALSATLAVIKEVHGEEHANAKTNEQLQALAKKLFFEASKSAESVERYALLQVARDIAAQGCHGQTAFQIIDEMDRGFQVDVVRMKASVLYSLTKKARLPADRKSIAEQALVLANQAVASDDFELAEKLVGMALSEARKVRDTSFVKQVASRNDEIKEFRKRFAQVKEAKEKLEEDPTDPEANLAVGRYRCLVKGDWENGLPMLALGSDGVLKELAMKELGEAAKPEEQAELGDRWWELSEGEEGMEREQVRARAVFWYQKALPKLEGLAKAKVIRRLEVFSEPETPPDRPEIPATTIRRAILMLTFEPNTFVRRGEKFWVTDRSGRNNHGEVHHTTLVPEGKVGGAIHLDGKQSQIVLPTLRAALENSRAFSVCFWVRTDGAGNGQPRYVFDVGFSANRCISVAFNHPSTLTFTLSTDFGGKSMEIDLPQPEQWHHVGATFDGNHQTLYLDGRPVATAATGRFVLNQNTLGKEVARIGSLTKKDARAKYRFLPGDLDEFCVFTACLTKEEIQSLFQMGLSGRSLADR